MEKRIFVWESTQQLSVGGMLLATFIPSGVATTGFHVVAPALVSAGMPSLYAWYFVALVALAAFVVAGLLLLAYDARILGVGVRERLCLTRISARMWLAAIAIMIVAIGLSFAAKPLVQPFMRLFGLHVPAYSPFFLDPAVVVSPSTTGTLAPGVILKGNYGLVGLQAVTLLFNISAEELYFRAWMLPKLSRYGKASWVINGALFAAYHVFQIWLFPQILIASLGVALVVRFTRSIWPAIAGHLVGNFLLGIVGFLALVFATGG
jgi:membrane protease YdiL (CAAX protease family)